MMLATCHLHKAIYREDLHILKYGTHEDTLLSLEGLESPKDYGGDMCGDQVVLPVGHSRSLEGR